MPLLRQEALVSGRPGRPRRARISSKAPAASSCPGRATARRPACDRIPRERTSASGRRSDRASPARPSRARPVRAPHKGPAGPSRRACAPPIPRTASTSAGSTSPFIDPEQTNPPASRGPRLRSLETRSSYGSSAGTTGRSLTTLSSGFRCMRRARTTKPARPAKVRGVEEIDLADLSVERVTPSPRLHALAATATVSFSSTLSAPLIRSSKSTRSSSDSPGALGVVAIS